MDTQTLVTIAVAINVVIALAAIVVPRVGDRAARRSAEVAAARRVAAGISENGGGRAATVASWDDQPSVSRGAVAHDPQTGLDLEAAWTRWLAEEDARARRYHRPATIVLVELAGLDRLVERLGRDAAERLIPPIAITMRRYGREADHMARLGPTRFGALLTDTDEVRAINYVERIRSACDVWLAAGAIALRLSIGWSEIGAERPASVALAEAEERLFAERQHGIAGDIATSGRREPPVSLAAASSG